MPSDRLHFRDVRSIGSFRLTLLLGGLFLTGVIAMLGLIYVLIGHELTARSDLILYEKAQSLLATPADGLPVRIQAEIDNGAQGFSYFALIDGDGSTVVGNVRLIRVVAFNRPFDAAARTGHGPLRMLAVRTRNRETILVGRDVSQIHSLRQRITQILIGSGVATLLGVFLAATIVSIKPLRRVRALQDASRAIAAGQLETRMPVAGRNDELDQIAATLNHMIEEVVRVIAQVKITTDAIAHDLRTPLTRVRARLHHLTHAPTPPVGQQAMIGETVAELDDVLARFAALLRISELEASARRSGQSPISLASLAHEIADLYDPLAEENGIAFAVVTEGDPVVIADQELLFEAVSNLVDNAIKFAASRVTLRVGHEDDEALLEVVDDGPGIAAEDRQAVFQRFHRLAGATNVPGSGLGLSIVSAILRIHGFSLALSDAEPGLVASVRMPPV
jgi:signal transduction histidine kinase